MAPNVTPAPAAGFGLAKGRTKATVLDQGYRDDALEAMVVQHG